MAGAATSIPPIPARTAIWRLLVPLVILCTLVDPVSAKNFPNKPLTVVVGFGVGGSADRMARSMSSYLAEELGQPVQVINKKGAGTLLASNYVLARPHDGYTIYASSFSPYLTNSIIEGTAEFTIEDFSYLNFQWFDEDLIALSKLSRYKSLPEVLQAVRNNPRTVRAACVRGSGGHLMSRLILESMGIPQENLNLVTYNSGGQARAAVAGGVVDFIVISAKGSESIREYLNPQAIVSDRPSEVWGVPPLNQVLAPLGVEVPILPGSVRGYAATAEFKKNYPERFELVASAFERVLARQEVQELLDQAGIGRRWVGPSESEAMMKTNFDIIKQYGYLLQY
jgi:tripartite-type tricarboxylate transporter receptor subunit TctC